MQVSMVLRIVALAALLGGVGCRERSSPATQPAGAASKPALVRYEYAQIHMGVQARMVLYAPSEDAAEEAARAAYKQVARLDDIASDYRSASELMLLCRKAGGPPVKVSEDLFILLQRSCEVAKVSNGGFDPTVGPLVALWRKSRKSGQLPAQDEIDAARKLVGYEKIKLDSAARTVQLTTPGMKLDLGAIAKGYAGDLATRALKEHLISSALFEFGGDIVCSDAPPGSEGWLVEIVSESADGKSKDVRLANCAISTSGDTEQFVVINGKRYSHVVDPHTGMGLTERTMVTVIGPDGLTTDSLSTAVCVTGPEGVEAMKKAYPGTKFAVRHVHD